MGKEIGFHKMSDNNAKENILDDFYDIFAKDRMTKIVD